MEARQGDATAVRYLFKRGMDVGPRSRQALDLSIWGLEPHFCNV